MCSQNVIVSHLCEHCKNTAGTTLFCVFRYKYGRFYWLKGHIVCVLLYKSIFFGLFSTFLNKHN